MRAEVSGRGPDFLEVALVWNFSYRILPRQTSKKFASEPPKILRSPSRKRFHVEAYIVLSKCPVGEHLGLHLLQTDSTIPFILSASTRKSE